MKFYYKTINGIIGKSDKLYQIPKDVDKLIIRRYDGSELQLNRIGTINHLILDCNRRKIGSIIFTTHNLSIYKPKIEWFHINDVWFSNGSRSTFNTLVRLKIEHVRNANCMLRNTLCNSIIPELDFTDMVVCSDAFKNTNIDNIPYNIKIPTDRKYVDFYKGSKIPQHKLLAGDTLLKISKKGKPS